MKGLSFSQPMVIAWNEGRKTVTRRVIKPQPFSVVGDQLQSDIWYAIYEEGVIDSGNEIKPRYLPGETVYIKEAWHVGGWADRWAHVYYNDGIPSTVSTPKEFIRQLNENERAWAHDKKKDPFRNRSPRFMPAWAARSHARIVSVRPERVQEIDVNEIQREGLTAFKDAGFWESNVMSEEEYIASFAELWDTLHKKDGLGWEVNPWVWRYELERVAP